MNVPRIQLVIYILGFLDLLGVSLILPLILPMVKNLGTSHVTAGAITSLYGAIQLFSSPAVDLVGASLIIPLIIIQVRDLGTSPVVAGAISSVYGILQLVTGPVMGRWSDISGRRPVILLCMMATAVSYIVLGSSQSLVIIILGRIIAGVFKHSQTLCRALLADVTTPEDRSRVFGVFNATSSMGFIVGPMLGGETLVSNLSLLKLK
ncbi:major facilitator superfamily domain-containing protein 9-like [Palaemon carinicauda]|uniref:major facilitator superfamily domain-containing protein 9-like n=1 Tax=Palaemon carinicauda TaxID=392227 RepID=UPI0035B5C196